MVRNSTVERERAGLAAAQAREETLKPGKAAELIARKMGIEALRQFATQSYSSNETSSVLRRAVAEARATFGAKPVQAALRSFGIDPAHFE